LNEDFRFSELESPGFIMIPILSELSANVVAFCRMLRQNGLPIGPAEEADALQALSLIRIGDPEEFRLALRTILASSRKEQDFFDRVYAAYWDGKMEPTLFHGQEEIELMKELSLRNLKQNRLNQTILNWVPVEESKEEEAAPGYSPLEVLTQKDFTNFSDEDFAEAIQILDKIAKLLSTRLSRRYRRSAKHQWIDFRKTIRLSLRSGGEVINLSFRERSLRWMKLVVLCDVSGSMDSYSRFLITFLYALQQNYGHIETFAFSTSLHRLTNILKRQSIAEALKEISKCVPDWSGGTKIGNCLQAFLEDYAGTILNKDTIVLILSDGWDIGETELMEQSMKQIHQRANRVIWLNPLLGSPDYEPNCLGMQAALPYIDDFLAAHNLESLRNLCNHLASVRKRKGLRLVR
jgi:uncharacterized protein with von Willebrand factor type A (vWA) domain